MSEGNSRLKGFASEKIFSWEDLLMKNFTFEFNSEGTFKEIFSFKGFFSRDSFWQPIHLGIMFDSIDLALFKHLLLIHYQVFAVPNANTRRLRWHGLLIGVFPSRPDLQKQASTPLALGRIQSPRPKVQKERQVTISSPPYKFYPSCVEFLQAYH